MQTPAVAVDFLAAALEYAALGLRVFPCLPRDKRPAVAHGFKEATTDADQIRAWWTRWPDANIGIATGDGLLWRMDGKPLGRGPRVAWLPWPGRHVVQITDVRGRVLDEIRIEVRGAGVVAGTGTSLPRAATP